MKKTVHTPIGDIYIACRWHTVLCTNSKYSTKFRKGKLVLHVFTHTCATEQNGMFPYNEIFPQFRIGDATPTNASYITILSIKPEVLVNKLQDVLTVTAIWQKLFKLKLLLNKEDLHSTRCHNYANEEKMRWAQCGNPPNFLLSSSLTVTQVFVKKNIRHNPPFVYIFYCTFSDRKSA